MGHKCGFVFSNIERQIGKGRKQECNAGIKCQDLFIYY